VRARLFTEVPRETVWKIRMGFTLGPHESAKRGEKHPYRCFALPKTRVSNPSNYFPNSFRRGILGSSAQPRSNTYERPRPRSAALKGIIWPSPGFLIILIGRGFVTLHTL
jgi:hypothetical protein